MALVFPSLYEGFGLPPLEAMAAGTPVIAMRSRRYRKSAGMRCSMRTVCPSPALAQAMESVATSPGLRDELRSRGQKRIEDFRWEQTARRHGRCLSLGGLTAFTAVAAGATIAPRCDHSLVRTAPCGRVVAIRTMSWISVSDESTDRDQERLQGA